MQGLTNEQIVFCS